MEDNLAGYVAIKFNFHPNICDMGAATYHWVTRPIGLATSEMRNTRKLSAVARLWSIRKTDFSNIWPSVLTRKSSSGPSTNSFGTCFPTNLPDHHKKAFQSTTSLEYGFGARWIPVMGRLEPFPTILANMMPL